jgi:ribonuclease P protein subunit RPR2
MNYTNNLSSMNTVHGRGISLSKRRVAKEGIEKLAQARIQILWQQALLESKTRPEIARKQMLNARRIAQRARIKIPRQISRQICRSCGTVLIPGATCRVRLRHNRARHVVVTCSYCGKIRRYYSLHRGAQA